MNDEPTENSQPPQDELEALHARVEELEASQPKAVESSNGRNGDEPGSGNGWPKTFARIIAIWVGIALGVLLINLVFPERTELERARDPFCTQC